MATGSASITSSSAAALAAEIVYKETMVCGVTILDQMNAAAVGSVSRLEDGNLNPTINGKAIRSGGKVEIGFQSLHRVTFEVVSQSFFRLTAEISNARTFWYVERASSGEFHVAYPYIPKKSISLNDVLPKVCTFTELNPDLNCQKAGYNSHGVFISGVNNKTDKPFFAWASPQDCAVDLIDIPTYNLDGTREGYAPNGSIGFKTSFYGCFLNFEKATMFDIHKVFADATALQRMKEEQRAQLTKETNVDLINKTPFKISVLKRPVMSNLSGRNIYEVCVENDPTKTQRVSNKSVTIVSSIRMALTSFDKSAQGKEAENQNTGVFELDTVPIVTSNKYNSSVHMENRNGPAKASDKPPSTNFSISRVENGKSAFVSISAPSNSAARLVAEIESKRTDIEGGYGEKLIDRTKDEAVDTIFSVTMIEQSTCPTINNKLVRTVGNLILGFNIRILTFKNTTNKIAEKDFFEIIPTASDSAPNIKKRWYVSKTALGQYHVAYRYIPQNDIQLKDVLPKICTLAEENPSFTLKDAGYNRHGVFVTGFDSETVKNFFAWASPQDSSVDIIDVPVVSQNGITTASTAEGDVSVEIRPEGIRLNAEPATRIDLKNAFQDDAELKKMKAAQRAQLTLQTIKSGLKVHNHTLFQISVLKRPARSRLTGMNTYEVWVGDKTLVYPRSGNTTALSNGRASYLRSVSMTFNSVPKNPSVIQCTEVDDKNTEVTYIDTTSIVNHIAFPSVKFMPQECSVKAMDQQLDKAKDLSISQIELVSFNQYGTLVITRYPRSFLYALCPNNLQQQHNIPLTVVENGSSFYAYTNRGDVIFRFNHLRDPINTEASINLSIANIFRPEQLIFYRGVKKILKEIERASQQQLLVPDLLELMLEFAKWNEFTPDGMMMPLLDMPVMENQEAAAAPAKANE